MDIKLNDDGTIELGNFSALQSFKIACHLEKEGLAHYERAMETAEKDEVKELMALLKDEEAIHLAFFEGRIEALDEEDGFEGDDIATIVSSQLFDKALPSDPLLHGMAMEERSIEFYNALMKNTTDEEGKAALKQIIKEEVIHLQRLKVFI